MLKPYFRKHDGWWYVQVRVGPACKQIKLVRGRDNEKRAYELFNGDLKAKEPEDVADMANLTVFDAFRLFIDWSRKRPSPRPPSLARHFLQSFIDHPFQGKPCGKLRVTALKPLHVTDWLTGNDWNPTTCNRAISLVKRASTGASSRACSPAIRSGT